MTVSDIQSASFQFTSYTLTVYRPPQGASSPWSTSPNTPAPGDLVSADAASTGAASPLVPDGAPGPGVPAAPAPALPAAQGDRVELSGQEPPARTSRRDPAQRADALFQALDAAADGAVTAEEFTEGAIALLRRAGARHHHHHHREGVAERSSGDAASRLGDRLQAVFERVDANQDGAIDKEELATALAEAAGRHRRHHGHEDRPRPTGEAPEAAATAAAQPGVVTVSSVTVVAVAIRQYTVLGQVPPSETPSAGSVIA